MSTFKGNNLNSINSSENTDEEVFLSVIFRTLLRRKKTLIYSALAGLFLGIIFIAFKKPVYKGQFQIVINKTNKGSSLKSLAEGNIGIDFLLGGKQSNKLKTEIKILESPSVLLPVFMFAKELKKNNGVDTSNMFFGKWRKYNFALENTRDTQVLNVAYKDTDKTIILPVIRKLSDTYQEYSKKGRNKNLDNVINYLKEQIIIYKQKSTLSLREVQEFSINNNLTSPTPVNISNLDTNFSNIKNSKNSKSKELPLINNFGSTEIQKNIAKDKIEKLEIQLDRIISSKNTETDTLFLLLNPTYSELGVVEEIEVLDKEIAKYKSFFKENDPLIKTTMLRRNILIKSLKNKTIAFINQEINEQKKLLNKFKRSKEVLIKYSELIRDHIRNDRALVGLENQLLAVSLEKARQEEPWQLISEPGLRSKPISPIKSFVIVMGIIIGTIFGSIIILNDERKKDIIFYIEEYKQIFGYEPMLMFKNFENMKNIIIPFSNKLKKDYLNNTIAFLSINLKTKNKFKLFFKELKENYDFDKLVSVNNIKDTNDFDKIIIVLNSGENSRKELIELIRILSLEDKVIGWIFNQ